MALELTDHLDRPALTARLGDHLSDQQAEEAEQLARRALKQYPADVAFRSGLALALLMQGRYREGFREYEGRPIRSSTPTRQLPYPEWDGPIAGRSILVWGEQGIGDEIQGARFIRMLRNEGAERITVACLPENIRAFQQLGADQIVSRVGQVSLPKHDCWALLWSIPYRLGLRVDDLSGASYLSAKPSRGGGIGLVESGNPRNRHDGDRSIPRGLLQAAAPQGRLLEPCGDVRDSLDLVAGLDLLITVDTSWAHMAGALGVPCWVLLPHRNLDWRWMRRRSDSPWYDSLRLFRQPTTGDWTSVLEAVSCELSAARATQSLGAQNRSAGMG